MSRSSAQLWDSSPRSLIARQLALTLEELDSARETYEHVRLGLLAAECELGTALLQPQQSGDRLRLQGQILRLQEQRQDFALRRSEQENDLARRLLELVNRWVHVTPEDEGG